MYWNCINYWVNNWISTHETTYGGYDATGTHLPYPYEAGSAATGSNWYQESLYPLMEQSKAASVCFVYSVTPVTDFHEVLCGRRLD
jgi:hypothetical protein